MDTQHAHSRQGEETPLGDLLRALRADLAGTLSGAGVLSDEDVTSALIGIERLDWQVQALKAELAAEAHTRSVTRPNGEALCTKHGCATPQEYLQRCTLGRKRELSGRIKLGLDLAEDMSLTGESLQPRMPHLAKANRAGLISSGSAKLIASTLRKVSWVKAEKLDYAERALVEAATGIDFETGTIAELQDALAKETTKAREHGKEEKAQPLEEATKAGLLDSFSLGSEDGTQVYPALAQDSDVIAQMCKMWGQYLDQDGTLPDDKALLSGRGLRIGRERDGLVPISGKLLPEVAALLAVLLDAVNSPRNHQSNEEPEEALEAAMEQPEDTPGETSGEKAETPDAQTQEGEPPETETQGVSGQGGFDEGEYADDEGRTPDHKRHDALAAILTMASAAAEMPNHGGAPVTVLVQTTQEALEEGGASWAHGPGSETTLLTPQATAHAACSGSLQYYAENARGRLVALGTKQRVFNGNQRKAILARDGGCVIPGCATPPAWCEIHHVTPHSHGGETHIDNGVALCWHHHRTLDTNGWSIRMQRGVPQVKAPPWVDPDRRWRLPAPPTKPPTYRRLSHGALPLMQKPDPKEPDPEDSDERQADAQ